MERDSIANSDDDGRRRRFLEPQGGGGSGGTSDALSWLMDPSQDTELGASSSRTKVTDAVKQSPRSMLKAATATTSKKRLKYVVCKIQQITERHFFLNNKIVRFIFGYII